MKWLASIIERTINGWLKGCRPLKAIIYKLLRLKTPSMRPSIIFSWPLENIKFITSIALEPRHGQMLQRLNISLCHSPLVYAVFVIQPQENVATGMLHIDATLSYLTLRYVSQNSFRVDLGPFRPIFADLTGKLTEHITHWPSSIWSQCIRMMLVYISKWRFGKIGEHPNHPF